MELSLETAKRGMRVTTGVGHRLVEECHGLGGYVGTVLEVTEGIPSACDCKDFVGKPGALVYWDHYLGRGQGYPGVLSREQAEAMTDKPQWVAFFVK